MRAEPADPVEVDQEIQRLEDHRHEHEGRGLQQLPGERSGGEVFHCASNVAFPNLSARRYTSGERHPAPEQLASARTAVAGRRDCPTGALRRRATAAPSKY